MLLRSLLAVLAGYLLGSFPSAYIAGRLAKGRDIRRIGGGNVGTLNTLREVGFIPGLLVFIADAAKGALAILVAKWLGVNEVVILIAGLASVAGHSWPVFLGFKGGKGGATGYGIFLALAPLAAAITFCVMLIIMLITSNARLSLTGGFITQPFFIWALGGSLAVIVYSVIVPLILGTRMLVADRHKLSDPGVRKNLIIDRDYTWWQSKRSKPSDNKK
ncbi:MAG: glycerol-3-phosphate acyltransferase [Dehalococcoidia bacterium]|nr:MAG: glycerol-3-phosphate acyltransferase [Dehalococcoidia bacterium]